GTGSSGAQKLLVLPKDTRPEIIESYRNAVNAMLADPEFQAAQTGALGSYKQVGGQTAQRLYTIGTNMPDESRRWIRNWLLRRYNVKLR
ncbi:MAG: tricarboxylate transporter, partial [Pseudomonadota bacterium]